MSTRPPRPTIDRCLGRSAKEALEATGPVDLERLAAAILGSEIADLELLCRLGLDEPLRNA